MFYTTTGKAYELLLRLPWVSTVAIIIITLWHWVRHSWLSNILTSLLTPARV